MKYYDHSQMANLYLMIDLYYNDVIVCKLFYL
jgi:hypothetical protein